MRRLRVVRQFLTVVLLACSFSALLIIPGAWATDYPWLSWRHDLQNTGAAPDFGYPIKPKLLWEQTRNNEPPLGTPARCSTPIVVGNDIVFATGYGGVVEARDQYTGDLIWTKTYTWIPQPPEPPDTPLDWCQGSTPNLQTNLGICAYTIDGKCPDWCYECTDMPNNCSSTSLISPLHFSPDYGVFVAGATIDTDADPARAYYGTMDGRFISVQLSDGITVWEKQPWKEPGGPNEGRKWYDQKFAWHLSPPSVDDGKLYFGSFLPSFYWVFKAFPFLLDAEGHSVPGWPSFDRDYKMYWVGRDGWTYCADKDTGNILWGWDPGGCGVTNIPPVAGGKVFFNADTVIDYHYGQMAACDVNTGDKLWHVGPVPMAQGGNPAISLARNTVFYPEGDGAVWAVDITTGQVKWTYHGGFSPMGATGVASSMAIDERRGWVLGASDTGHIFVLDMDTGRLIRETYMGIPSWKPRDGQPKSGYWFPGASAMAIVPKQGILYIAGTDFDRAWQGGGSKGREKLFCYRYTNCGNTLKQLWDYQFFGPDDNEFIVKGHDPYQVAFYTLGSPALADGHVYYGSYNGHVYCFGNSYRNVPQE